MHIIISTATQDNYLCDSHIILLYLTVFVSFNGMLEKFRVTQELNSSVTSDLKREGLRYFYLEDTDE